MIIMITNTDLLPVMEAATVPAALLMEVSNIH